MSHIVQFINMLEKRIFTLDEDGITYMEMEELSKLMIHRGNQIEEHGVLMGLYKDSENKNFLIQPSENPN